MKEGPWLLNTLSPHHCFEMKIGLLSDTHGYIHPSLYEFFSSCDEIWHAGDIGSLETADRLAEFKPLRAVHGNIDDGKVRRVYGKDLRFMAEEVRVWMTHIGGRPGNYDPRVKALLVTNPPDLFICGHSHIARIMHDNKGGFLYVNPGAAGNTGFHEFMTAVRFEIAGKVIKSMELIELGKRGRING